MLLRWHMVIASPGQSFALHDAGLPLSTTAHASIPVRLGHDLSWLHPMHIEFRGAGAALCYVANPPRLDAAAKSLKAPKLITRFSNALMYWRSREDSNFRPSV